MANCKHKHLQWADLQTESLDSNYTSPPATPAWVSLSNSRVETQELDKEVEERNRSLQKLANQVEEVEANLALEEKHGKYLLEQASEIDLEWEAQ